MYYGASKRFRSPVLGKILIVMCSGGERGTASDDVEYIDIAWRLRRGRSARE